VRTGGNRPRPKPSTGYFTRSAERDRLALSPVTAGCRSLDMVVTARSLSGPQCASNAHLGPFVVFGVRTVHSVTFTVGFDLDMTLIDPRPGMLELFQVLAGETGLPLDGHAFVSRLGRPLRNEFARYGLDAATVERLIARYRELYVDVVIPATRPMPGATAALRCVAAHGGRSIVVTAKHAAHAKRHLDSLQMEVSTVSGDLWSSDKAAALVEYGAEIFVGDHLGDITGARSADALAVGVATGPIDAEHLTAAGADVVLADLTAFPAWLENYLLATVH